MQREFAKEGQAMHKMLSIYQTELQQLRQQIRQGNKQLDRQGNKQLDRQGNKQLDNPCARDAECEAVNEAVHYLHSCSC